MSARRGFTVLEVLISALLLGLIVTFLTALLNQSTTAWSVGESSLLETGSRRQVLSEASRRISALYPMQGGSTAVRLLSPWTDGDEVRVDRPLQIVESPELDRGSASLEQDLSSEQGRTRRAIRVEVSSAGPDRVWGTEDDLTTLPQEDFE